MVYYYIFPRQTAEEMPHPDLILKIHGLMKGIQVGLLAGAAVGLCGGMMRTSLSRAGLLADTTTAMVAGGLTGAFCGPLYVWKRSMEFSRDDNRDRAFRLSRSIWQNRMDIMTGAGMAGGLFFGRPKLWVGLFGFSYRQSAIKGAGIAWGGLLGTVLDVPLVVLGPVYGSNTAEVDFIRRHLSVIRQAEIDADEELAAEAEADDMQDEEPVEDGEE